ncbi:apolipoprotein D and lipocalin family protein [Chitinophaga skermanii]|uniref:Outer membrane lipoprotein Blc n=1 Tax=Chitinophaga skermanii TaxID=331697 RepID=A0A327QQ77_9BACT|nr:lipocalin family protein [Chitinophaga skermanii]RAJ06766.1 apolipoprotein D and lipocalin family protein [Chitinophaga skermanii]
MNKKLIFAGAAAAIAATAAYLYTRAGKVSMPKGAEAVKDFEVEKYLGTWYEIARLDYKFERNLSNVTAHYSLDEKGQVVVDNKGFNYKKGKWLESVGKAKFVGDPHEARLKVSFWGPIWNGYNVIAIDADYQHALVVGDDKNYMWILSRNKRIPKHVKQSFLLKASSLGYDVNDLTWTKHRNMHVA